MTAPLTVLVVEDAQQSFKAVHMLLTELGHRVLQRVETLDEATQVIEQENPDILLMDLALGHYPDQVESYKRLKQSADFVVRLSEERPGLTILVHSGADKLQSEIVALIVHAGISYLIKEAVNDAAHLDRAIKHARTKGAIYDHHVVGFFDKIVPAPGRSLGLLTPREWDVAALVENMTNAQIALCLKISSNRVGELMTSIMRKLGFDSRTQVALWYREQKQKDRVPLPPRCGEKI